MNYREQAAALDVAALLALPAASGLVVLARADGVPALHALAFGAAAIALAGLPLFAAWRDPVIFCKHAFVASLFVLAACAFGLVAAEAGQKPVLLTAAVVVLAAGFLGGYAWLPRRWPGPPSALPFERLPVREMGGIRLAFDGSARLQPGRSAPLAVLLESCWTGPREVTIELAEEQERVGAPLRIARRIVATLGPLEAKRGELHVQAPVHGDYRILLTVTLRGWRGRRARHPRADEFRNRVTPVEQLTYLAAGELRWGGGLRLNFDAPPGPTAAEPWTDEVAWTRLGPASGEGSRLPRTRSTLG